MTFRSGQTVSGVSLSGSVTGKVLRVRPSIIDRSVLIVDLDVDGVEHNVPAEDCTLVRPARPAPQEDPVTATAEAPQQIPAATHGWMHPNRSHLAHWGNGTRVLCGRMVPTGTEIVNTDPHANVPRCSKCDKALQRELQARTDASAPAATDATAAEPQSYVPQVGDDVRVGTGRPDVAVIVNLKGDEAQVLYADETRMWVPARSLSKAHTAQQPGETQPVPAPAAATPWTVGMPVEFTYGHPEADTRAQGVIAKIFGDGNRRYNKDCQVKYGKAFYYRNFDDLTPVSAQTETEAEPVNPSDTPEPVRFQVPEFEPAALGMQQVPWSSIRNSALNPRKHFDEAALRELAVSIYRKGLQQNLVVRPHPERNGLYEIAAGERRWRAIGLLVQGFEADGHEWLEWPAATPVNVLVQDLSDLELLEVATAENVQRRRMTPMEEADAFAALVRHGSTPDDIASKFGYTRRTVIRRVQISENLSPLIREQFESGVLSLAQVEVLATVAPEVQDATWNGYLRADPRLYPAEHIRKHLSGRLFLVSTAKFPPAWYQGGVVEADLFDDVEPYFQDPAQALACQLRHARVLAEQAVADGAAFAEVTLDAARYHFGGTGTGVVFNVSARTGVLEHWANVGPRNSWQPRKDRDVLIENPTLTRAESGTSAGTPAGTTSAPAKAAPTPDRAVYPASWQIETERMDRMLTGPDRRRRLQAAFVLDCIIDARVPDAHADTTRTADRLAATLTPLLKRNGDGWTLHNRNADEAAIVESGTTVLRVLLTLTPADLDDLFYAYFTAEMHLNCGETETILANLDPFILTAGFLASCNTLALQEIWDAAELGDRENTSDEYLRSMLLEEAPALAARGFLPRPLRPDGDAQ